MSDWAKEQTKKLNELHKDSARKLRASAEKARQMNSDLAKVFDDMAKKREAMIR